MITCAFCGKTVKDTPRPLVVETRNGKTLCLSCAEKKNFCEICGSTSDDPETQLHHTECFK